MTSRIPHPRHNQRHPPILRNRNDQAQGLLRPGQTVVELTSGNTGTGLAIVCAVKGYRFVAVMSRGNSVERARMMAALGAEVVLVDQLPESRPGEVSGGDLARVEQVAQALVRERGAYRADQFRLEGKYRAHYLNTGPEVLAQAGCRIDGFCDFAGTGGSFVGCAKAFKERDPATRCFVVEPSGAAVLAGELRGKTVVVLLNDSGLNYLSTDLWY